MAERKVLLTGASGFVASLLLPALRERYACTLLDVKSADENGRAVSGVELVDLEAASLEDLRPMVAGQDAIVHLAVVRHGEGMHRFEDEMANLRIAYKLFQLGLEENVRRVVMTSSIHAAIYYETLAMRREVESVAPTNDMRPLSTNFYGWAKAGAEHLAFVFASGSLGRKLETVMIRLGSPRPVPWDIEDADYDVRRQLAIHISRRDLIQLIVRSVEEGPIENEWGIPWQVFYGISDNTRAFCSLANARKVIGYRPEDDSEVIWADQIHARLTSQGVTGRVGSGR